MRAELYYDGTAERIDLPEGDIYGISVISADGRIHIEAVNIDNLDSDVLDEENIVLQKVERITKDGITVCVFCWKAAFLEFIPEMMAMYTGMKYIEICQGSITAELIC